MSYPKHEKVWFLMKENDFEIDFKMFPYLACVDCRNILIKASFPPCGCRYCYDCIKEFEGQHCIGNDEECKRQRINLKENISMDSYIDDIVLKLEVKCPNSICEYRGRLKEMPEHLQYCLDTNSSLNNSLKTRSDSGFISLKRNRSYGWEENINNEIRQMKTEIENLKNENKRLLNSVNSLLERDKEFKVSHDHFQIVSHNCMKIVSDELNPLHPKSEPKLVWKIEKFSEKKTLAQFLFKTEIKSESFFTDPLGYKMRLTVFPSGFGDGKDSHLSVVFCLLKGPHDNNLKWPMKREIMISLINQDSESSHCSKKYQFESTIDNMKFVFSKPTTNENRGFGTSRFISLADLTENKSLCKNDTIILTCSVSSD